MKINITARDIKYDAKGFITATFKSIRQRMIEAAQDFILAAVGNDGVPIDTGMARGSYLNMLQLINRPTDADITGLHAADSLIPTTARHRLKSGNYLKYTHSDGEQYRKEPKTAKKFTTSRGQIVKREGDKIRFEYNIDVVHYNIMDEFNPYGESWHSIRRGKEAFINNLSRFKPSGINKYLVISRQTFGTRGDGTQTTLRNQKTIK